MLNRENEDIPKSDPKNPNLISSFGTQIDDQVDVHRVRGVRTSFEHMAAAYDPFIVKPTPPDFPKKRTMLVEILGAVGAVPSCKYFATFLNISEEIAGNFGLILVGGIVLSFFNEIFNCLNQRRNFEKFKNLDVHEEAYGRLKNLQKFGKMEIEKNKNELNLNNTRGLKDLLFWWCPKFSKRNHEKEQLDKEEINNRYKNLN